MFVGCGLVFRGIVVWREEKRCEAVKLLSCLVSVCLDLVWERIMARNGFVERIGGEKSISGLSQPCCIMPRTWFSEDQGR